MPQQGHGQGAAGMLQERHGWVKRPQGRLQARQNRARAATEPQEMRAVAQLQEAKVRGAAKPPPWAAQLPIAMGGRLGVVA